MKKSLKILTTITGALTLGAMIVAIPVGVSTSENGLTLKQNTAHARRGAVRFVFGKPGAPSKNRRLILKLRKRAAQNRAKAAANIAKAAAKRAANAAKAAAKAAK